MTKRTLEPPVLEFLMTYSGVIIVVLIAIGALAYFGAYESFRAVFQDEQPPEPTFQPVEECIEWRENDDAKFFYLQIGFDALRYDTTMNWSKYWEVYETIPKTCTRYEAVNLSQTLEEAKSCESICERGYKLNDECYVDDYCYDGKSYPINGACPNNGAASGHTENPTLRNCTVTQSWLEERR